MEKEKKHQRKCPFKEKKQNSLSEKMTSLMYRFGKDPKGTLIGLENSDIVLLLGQKGKISERDYELVFDTFLSRASVRSLVKFAEKYGNEDKRDEILNSIFARKSYDDGRLVFLCAKRREHRIRGIKMMKDASYNSFIYYVHMAFQHHDLLIQGKLDGTVKQGLIDCRQKWQTIYGFERELGIEYKDSKYRVDILKKLLDPHTKGILLN